MLYRALCCVCCAALISGCTTEAAKKAMNKPTSSDQYAGFDSNDASGSKRKAEMPKPVPDTMDPESAVSTLVDQLQSKQASFTIAAEDQLNYWASKPGVSKIVVRKVRPMLKSPRVEHRAAAARLTVQYGRADSVGDLIECLSDSEPGIRTMAYSALQGYATQDFAYDPNASAGAREKSVEQYRKWWQNNQRRVAVQPATVYEGNPPSEPRVVSPGQTSVAP